MTAACSTLGWPGAVVVIVFILAIFGFGGAVFWWITR